ncbi:MAG: AAA family ATPase [Lachnospiraceae bacterium]|nr:AAA family ATPase [Lachnospiraceae bacterium]
MHKEEFVKRMSEGGISDIISELERTVDEDYDEQSMFYLAVAYLANSEVKKAKKLIKKLRMLYPSGELIIETGDVFAAIESDSYNRYVDKILGIDRDKIEREAKQEKDAEESLIDSLMRTKAKKERIVSENIRDYFTDVIGLEYVQSELTDFYNALRFQNERKQSAFNGEIVSYTNFAITGKRGCGKKMIARIISQMLFDVGVRGDDEPVIIHSRKLIDAIMNDTSKGLSDIFSNLSDCTVVIEAFQDFVSEIGNNDSTFNRTVYELVETMRNRQDSLSFIISGSKASIDALYRINSDVEKCIFKTINIHPYKPDELLEIAKRIASQKALRLDSGAEKALAHILELESKSAGFMNAISINELFDKAALKLANRYYESDDDTDAAKVLIKKEDFDFNESNEGIGDLLAELESLPGLYDVKKEVRKRIEEITIENHAKEIGVYRGGNAGSLHMVFTGNPGTGKTTVARLIGKIYCQLGVISRGDRFVECSRSDLVGMYMGHTAKQVQAKINEAMGGVLFVDEAYALCRGDNDSFGHEAVDELIAAMENYRDSLIVILAGYKDEMAEFLKSNPGFNSRIRNIIEFKDYTPDEMIEIYKGMAARKGMLFENGADQYIAHMINTRSTVQDFGNARGVRNLFDETIEYMNSRIIVGARNGMTITKETYSLILNSDIEKVAGKNLETEKSIDELLDELNGLTGLTMAKKKVQEIIDDIQFKQYMRTQGSDISNNHGTLHLVFLGNAGTGKTTVARLIGRIYKQLGVLKKSIFIEVGRKDLVAGYQGQTAEKVMKVIKEAEGGILFIDEAYTLMNGVNDSFGLEAINTLVAEIENRRDSLMVIVAGYASEMRKFLDANQGLASRLSNEVVFEDYSDDELLQICMNMFSSKDMLIENELEEEIRNLIIKEKSSVKDFGNARGVRNIVERLEKHKNSRIAAMIRAGQNFSTDYAKTIIREDII